MWVAKIRIEGEKALLGGLAKRCSISMMGYPIHVKEFENFFEVDIVGTISGSKENEAEFLKIIKQSSRVISITIEDNLLFGKIREPMNYSPVYFPGLIHIEPVYINEDGIEHWTLGSSDKKSIIDFIESIEEMPGADVISIYQQKMNSFMVMSARPSLSPKQRSAMDLAIKKGYYNYPRKTNVEELAKLSGVSFSTFQAHLRKAENRFFPYSFNKFYKQAPKLKASKAVPEALPS
jgi:HTH DNA binding domain